jgi:hypothetical protein
MWETYSYKRWGVAQPSEIKREWNCVSAGDNGYSSSMTQDLRKGICCSEQVCMIWMTLLAYTIP